VGVDAAGYERDTGAVCRAIYYRLCSGETTMGCFVGEEACLLPLGRQLRARLVLAVFEIFECL